MPNHATKRPQPILTRARIITALAILSALLVKVGAGSVPAWLDEYSAWIAGAVLAVGPLVTGYLARRHTTPTSSPRDNDGNQLVPVGTAAAEVDDGGSEAASVVDEALADAERIHPATTAS
jgi:hypothetical protein